MPTDNLAASITQALKEKQIGLRNLWGQHNYLPDQRRTELITKDAIQKALPLATTNLVDYIHDDASRTFSMVLIAIEDHEQRLEAMEAFYFHGLRDSEHLPVPDMAADDCCEHFWQKSDRKKCHSECTASPRGTCNARHDQVYDCFHHSCWDEMRFYRFHLNQRSFVMQHFNTKVFQHHNIADDRVLPFLPREGMEPIRGGFGEVYPAKMLAGYLIDSERLIDVDSKEDINIAIKVLKPDDKGRYNLKEEWERESNAHKDLNGLDTHLIKAFSAFQYRGDFCLLLEWADGGSLQSLLKNELRPLLTKEAILELLDQLVGLANAMHVMHNKDFLHCEDPVPANTFESFHSQTGDDRSLDAASGSRADQSVGTVIPRAIRVTSDLVPEISIEPPKDLTGADGQPEKSFENWRHGDIKPANILRFKGKDVHGKDLWLGTLKLADLGRAKQRKGITRYQTNQEIDVWRSEAHEAPDIHVNPHASMSRLYDSWSMGTVIFELIVWMLYGKQQLHNFTDTTAAFETQGSAYWTRSSPRSAEVSAMAKLWMSHILREDIECNRPEGTVMGDLMKLVRDELLVIDLPPLDSRDIDKAEKGQRSSAARLCDRLKEIRDRAHNDEEYLFTGNDRSGMQPPPSGDAAVAGITVMRSEPVAVQKVAARSGLLSPNAAEDRALNTRQRNTYTHGLEDKWLYEDDNHFARRIMELAEVAEAELADVDESEFCKTCQSFKAMSMKFFTRSIPDLDGSCSLCQMLKRCVGRLGLDLGKPLVLARSGGSYITGKTGRAVLRVCREPQPSSPSPFDTEGIPVGLPLLSPAGGPAHVAILKAWLRDCDDSDQHKSCRLSKPVFVPKRLLHVGEKNSCFSKVIETASHLSDKSVNYLALSHPWGKESSTNVHFKSDKDNIKKRMKKIRDCELPLTFKHAVQMARNLEVQYIWIDSICILQKTDTDPGDFQEEAKSMESIYASAYCVIAASSAEGMNSGFLSDERDERIAIQLPQVDKSDPPATYLCEAIDDFQGDVLDGPLNERGWALQERALARRTIFFTKTQTYWECSQGIRCQTLSKLTNQKVKFIGDSNFPSYANSPEGRGRGAQEFLFEELYADYSRLKFSLLTDKPIAISGLEQRLTRAIGTPSGAGIFIKFWGRFLLWERNDPEVAALVRISKPPPVASGTTGSKVRMPPSWSWMAYEGGISYLKPPKGRTVWNEKAIQLRLTGSGEISWLFAIDELGFSAPIKSFTEGENTADGDYQLTYDNPHESKSKQKKCVIIGSVQDVAHAEKGIHYVLIVSLVATKGSSNTWERIGAGKLHGRFIPDVNAASGSAEIV